MRLLLAVLLLAHIAVAEPVVYPYLQNQTAGSVDLYWVDTKPDSVRVEWLGRSVESGSDPVSQLDYHPVEKSEFPGLPPRERFLHRVTLDRLEGSAPIRYTVHFPGETYSQSFKPLPSQKQFVRLIAYADSETEPESTGKRADWGNEENPDRKYLVDQTVGYAENLRLIRSRQPNAILIAGDLVESGGEQRDWDEFWKHNKAVAGSVPLLPAPGNHEYYAGPRHGSYDQDASRRAIAKFRTYFHPEGPDKSSHYYARDIGLVTVISLDSNDSLPHRSALDSNHYLQAAGSFAPSFHPESDQVRWLEEQLSSAQSRGQFTIVMFHHCPYSSGPHGFEAGTGEAEDPQSGQALRLLTPLFHRYGADLLITGHDEMMERSVVEGAEVLPEGRVRRSSLLVYDVGIGGDGLRGPERENEWQEFLAYLDAPEVWEHGQLVSGGRHYGHLEIDVVPYEGGWRATLTPVYVLPVRRDDGWEFERRVYPDVVVLTSKRSPQSQ